MATLSQFTNQQKTISIQIWAVSSGGGGAGAVSGGAYGGGGGGGALYYNELDLPRGTTILLSMGAGGAGGPGETGGSGGVGVVIDFRKNSVSLGVGDLLYSKTIILYGGGAGGGGGSTYGGGGSGGCGGGVGQGSGPTPTTGPYNAFFNETGLNGKSVYTMGKRSITSSPADTTNNVITNLSPGFHGVDANWITSGASNLADTMGGGLNLGILELRNIVPNSNYFNTTQNAFPIVSVGGYYTRLAGISTANTGNGGNGTTTGGTGENGQSGIALVTYSNIENSAFTSGSVTESFLASGSIAYVFTGTGYITLPN